MQDIKRNKRRMTNQQMAPTSKKRNVEERAVEVETVCEDLSRGCGQKPQPKPYPCHDNGCHIDKCYDSKPDCDCECSCSCSCKPDNGCHKKPVCEPCQIETKECIDNSHCEHDCCNPISPKCSTANAKPYAIEANRVYDTMAFQTFTDAVAPNGESLTFDYDVVDVKGPVPKSGPVNVTIEKVCINYSGIVIDTGCTTLEDYDIQALEPVVGRPCETTFEYAVCGERNSDCCKKGKGKNVVYKQRGLNIIVEDLVLELKGKCGCTEFTAYAYPSVRGLGGQMRRCGDVEFVFNTLSAPICLPADGRSVTLRQDFQTSLTVDCIGKAILRYVDHDGCECYYDLCIPNDIDLVLCLQSVVSTLVNEQVVVLGLPNAIQPRIVDTFNKVCDFRTCGDKSNESENDNEGHCGCNR